MDRKTERKEREDRGERQFRKNAKERECEGEIKSNRESRRDYSIEKEISSG